MPVSELTSIPFDPGPFLGPTWKEHTSVSQSRIALQSLPTYHTWRGPVAESLASAPVLQDVCPRRARLGWLGRGKLGCAQVPRTRAYCSSLPGPGAWCRGGNVRREQRAAHLNPFPICRTGDAADPDRGSVGKPYSHWFWNLSLPRVGCKSVKPHCSAVSLWEVGARRC